MRNLQYLLLGLCLSGLVAAQTQRIYRSVDKDGNVVFSDTPTEGAEELILKDVTTINSLTVPETSKPWQTQGVEVLTYNVLKITAPVNEEAIRDNSGNVNVLVELLPGLQGAHKLTLYIDGSEHSDSTAPAFSLTNLDRGTHQLRVAVRDKDGKILLSSPSVIFHLLRASVKRQQAAPPHPPAK